MSMISGQCDKLRETADRLDGIADISTPWIHRHLTPMLRDAADLILELRDNLQCANEAVRDAEHDESMAWDRVRKAEAESKKLREERDMYRDLVDHMVHPDISDQLAAENAKLRETCAELREACAELLKMAESHDPEWLHWPEMYEELRKLGVEVE